MIIKYLEAWIIRTFIIKACEILIVEMQLVMNWVEVGISDFNVNGDYLFSVVCLYIYIGLSR